MARKKDKTKDRKRRNKSGKTMAQRADRHVLYEQSVQCVESEIDFVDETFERIRQRKAVHLREDFCGTANTSCEWIRRRSGNTAIGVDVDAGVLEWGREHHISSLKAAQRARIELIDADVLEVNAAPQDVVLAMNFSYWLFRDRDRLRRYFSRVRNALADDGVFFLDAFGGYDAFRVLKERTAHDDFSYVWDQADYNPVNGEMTCHIHFKFKDGSRLRKAFSYHWRLWTLPEIREILEEAGFVKTAIYWQGWDEETGEGDGNFKAVEAAEPDAGWIAYIVALK